MPGTKLIAFTHAAVMGLATASVVPARGITAAPRLEIVSPVPWDTGLSVAFVGSPSLVPLEILQEDEHAPLRVRVRNTSDRKITALALETESLRLGTSSKSLWIQDAFGGGALGISGTEDDLRLLPGDERLIRLGIGPGNFNTERSDALGFVVRLVALVYDDTTFEGDARIAGRIFAARAEVLADYRQRWALSEGADREAPNELAEIVANLVRQLPSGYLGGHPLDGSEPDTVNRRRVRPYDEITNGSCRLVASESRLTNNGCFLHGNQEISVKETWRHTCQEPFGGLGAEDRLTGLGSCHLGKECWPQFSGPVETYDVAEAKLKWRRSVVSQAATAPFGRCFPLGNEILEKSCP